MNDISQVSVEGLDDLLSALRGGHSDLSDDLESIRSTMRSEGVTMLTLNDIDRIAEWVDDQIPGLERRRNLAVALTGDQPTSTPVSFDEPLDFDSPEEAEQYGRELARQFEGDGAIDEEFFDELMAEFEKYATDPDVMAGFYLELGPENAEMLPEWLYASGAGDAERYLELFSIGLGVALSTDNYTSGTSDYYTEFADFRTHFREGVDDPSMAWGRMALLQYGDFPSRWLADVVRNNVLEDFEGDDWDHTDYRSGVHSRLGLSEDVLALAFSALGNNGSAARIALSEKANISIDEYTERVYGYGGSRGTGDEVVDAFGLTLAAGSGALEDPPDKGHSASEFAFESIVALGDHGEQTPWRMQEHVGTIAAAYAEELLAGSYTIDGQMRDSSMEVPEGLPPGIDPNFMLNPEDVYQFLYGMGGDDQYSADFDAAMQELYETLPQAAIEADVAAMENGEMDPRHFENILSMFGTVAGLQYHSQRQVRGDMDEADENLRQNLAFGGGAVLTMLPVNVDGYLDLGWRITQVAANGVLGDWAGKSDSRVEELDELAAQANLLNDYMIAQMMLDAGYPTSKDLPGSLTDDNGNLLPPEDIATDETLRNDFYEWTDDNDTVVEGHDDTTPFDTKFDAGWNYHDAGRGSKAEEIAREVGWGPSFNG